MRKIRVLITDDHSVVRSALRCLLDRDAAIDVVGEASDGQQACSMAQDLRADLVCMDCRMNGMDGIETTRRLLAAMPEMKIIGLSAAVDDGTESRMLAAGASRYVNKANLWEELLPAIHALFPRHGWQDGVASAAEPLAPEAMQLMLQQLQLRQVELEAQNAALRDASKAALQTQQEARQAAARAAAASSHALRQPLSAIGIYANVLKSHVAPAGQPLLANLKDCVDSLSALLDKFEL